MLDPDAGTAVAIAEVSAALISAAEQAGRPVEGITLLGGEPTEQADAVAELFESLQALGWSTMLYSGYTLEALRRRGPSVARLLSASDLLVDGPFLQARYEEGLAWRGSSNQQLHCLTERYDGASLKAAFRAQGKGFSLDLRADGSMALSGLQLRVGAARLESQLAASLNSTVGNRGGLK